VQAGPELVRPPRPRLVQCPGAGGSQDVVLGELRVLPSASRGNTGRRADSSREAVEGEVHLRLMAEGDDRYCCLCVRELEGRRIDTWRPLHTGTLDGWGSARAKGKAAAQARLEQGTWLSMHRLVNQGVVELRASSDTEHGMASFQDVSVSVRLKSAAIVPGALHGALLEDIHGGRKYASDLRAIMGWLQPALVDLRAEAAAPAQAVEEVGFQTQKTWLHEAMKHALSEPCAAPHPALKPTLRPYQERAAKW
jgi:hypothetical protein